MNENINISVSSDTLLKSALAIVCLVLAGWLVWLHYFKPVERAGEVKEAKAAPEVAAVPKTDIAPPKVKVYAGGAPVKLKLSLPQSVVDNAGQHVIASSKIAASEHPHTVTTVIDEKTGESQTFVRTDPLPWVAYSSKGAAGIYYGIKSGKQVARLQVRQDVLQVKALRAGVMASVDSDGQTFAGVGLEYRW